MKVHGSWTINLHGLPFFRTCPPQDLLVWALGTSRKCKLCLAPTLYKRKSDVCSFMLSTCVRIIKVLNYSYLTCIPTRAARPPTGSCLWNGRGRKTLNVAPPCATVSFPRKTQKWCRVALEMARKVWRAMASLPFLQVNWLAFISCHTFKTNGA